MPAVWTGSYVPCLPEERLARELSFRREVKLEAARDNPLWVCVTTEDGYQAWSSPIYLFG